MYKCQEVIRQLMRYLARSHVWPSSVGHALLSQLDNGTPRGTPALEW